MAIFFHLDKKNQFFVKILIFGFQVKIFQFFGV